MQPEVDVLIVSYNARTDVEACLRSLAALDPSPVARVIVVDNASTDGTGTALEAAATDWPRIDVVRLDRNIGFGAANNIGLRRASAPLSLLLNPDTIVAPGAIEALADRLVATGAVAVGPRLVDRDGRPEVSFGPPISPLGELRQWTRQRLARSSTGVARRLTERLVSGERTVAWVTAACCLVVRSAVVDAGMFDERYFLYEEDVDLCAALSARGGRIVFAPSVTVMHARGQSGRSTPAATRAHYDRSHLLFYEKHLPHWAPFLRAWLRVRGRSFR